MAPRLVTPSMSLPLETPVATIQAPKSPWRGGWSPHKKNKQKKQAKLRHAAADGGDGPMSKCNRTGLFLHGDALEGAVVVVGSNLLDVGPRPRLGYSPIYIVRRPLDVAAV